MEGWRRTQQAGRWTCVLLCDLFLGARGAVGPGAELGQQAVDGAALLITASGVVLVTQLEAAVLPVIVIILRHSVEQSQQMTFPSRTCGQHLCSSLTSDASGHHGCRF